MNFFFLEVGKILFTENLVGKKRRERLHIVECRGTRKPVIPKAYEFNPSYLGGSDQRIRVYLPR
jgi:hypothetical protein